MTLTQKTQKNPIYKRIFLFFMTLSHFWSLVAVKAKKLNFEISKNGSKSVFYFFSLQDSALRQRRAVMTLLYFISAN